MSHIYDILSQIYYWYTSCNMISERGSPEEMRDGGSKTDV